MVLEIFLVIFAAAAAAWVTWTFNTRIYDQKLKNYTKVIGDFDQQNKELLRQLNTTRQNLQNETNNPKMKELEKKNRELSEQHTKTITIVNKIRSKIENDYASHSLGQFVMLEFEAISPSQKAIEAQKQKEAQASFQRIRAQMNGSDLPAGVKIGDLAKGR